MSGLINQFIACRGSGGPEVLQLAERPAPVPAADEILIRVSAAGVNRADILQRRGNYPPPPGASDILGLEVSGTVIALGANARRWRMGDKVCALLAGGGYAKYVAVPEAHCLPIPPNISFVEAAALPEAMATVWANVFEAAALQPGETILVHGGSSGIGTTAIQMVLAHGGKIIVTAGSDEKVQACLKLGAQVAINYKKEDFVKKILESTAGRGVNVVLDMIGGDYLARNLSVLAPFGWHISIAAQGGRIASIDLLTLMQRQLIVTGSHLRSRPKDEKSRLLRVLSEHAWAWVLSGRVKPVIHKTFPIKDVAEAHKLMESGAHIGKLVLEVPA